MRAVLAAALLVLGCGRIYFDPRTDAAAGNDVLCTGPFGPPRNLVEVNSISDDEANTLSNDGLELYFASDRGGSFDLYVATRSDRAASFGAPTRLVQLATVGLDNDPFVEADGLTLWFNSDGVPEVATRSDRSSPWGSAQVVTELDTPTYYTGGVALTNDGLTVYFGSDRPGTRGSRDLYRATRPAKTAPFGPAVHEVTASSNLYECCPALSVDERSVLFQTNRAGNNDIYIATIDGSGDLGPATEFPLFNTASDEWDVDITPDDQYISFASDRPGGVGGHDLYVMERTCP